ncbi:hypothetical protein Gotur_009932, partial [Gossypium turneri]
EKYSRNAECNTGKFPDVVSVISRFKKSSVKSFVLDCEFVAYDRVRLAVDAILMAEGAERKEHMGIKVLTKLLADNVPKAMKEQKLESYFGRKIAIDASMSIYHFIYFLLGNLIVYVNIICYIHYFIYL